MAEFRRIIKPFLVILLQFSAGSHQVSYKFVKEGQSVTLPCDYVAPGQARCELTTWIHETETEDMELISLGEVGVEVAQRVNLTDGCSLLLKNVAYQEAGKYTCKQYDSFGQTETRRSIISLSIVSLSKVVEIVKTEFICTVSTNLRCTNVQVKWLINDTQMTKTNPHLRVNKSSCSASVSVPTSHKHVGQLTCEVTHDDKNYHFREKQEESLLTTTEMKITLKWTDRPNKETTQQQEQNRLNDNNERRDSEEWTEYLQKRWWWAAVAVAVIFIIAVVIFVSWRRVKGKSIEPNNDPSAEGVSYSTINFNKRHKKTLVRVNEEMVIYSPVRSSASVDDAQLYASVSKCK